MNYESLIVNFNPGGTATCTCTYVNAAGDRMQLNSRLTPAEATSTSKILERVSKELLERD